MATAALTDARWLTYRRGGGVTTESSSVVVLNERNEVLLGLRADARMWALLQRLRRADRWWQRRVRRRQYPFLLPGEVQRHV